MKHSYYIAAHRMSHLMREVEYYTINSQVLAPRALVCIPTRNGSFQRQVGTGEIKYPCILMTFILSSTCVCGCYAVQTSTCAAT
jgi:hypothetical protein